MAIAAERPLLGQARKEARKEPTITERVNIAKSLLAEYKENIPPLVFEQSMEIIDQAHADFVAPRESLAGKADQAFFVFTRRHREQGDPITDEFRAFDDSTRAIPALNPDYGIPEGVVDSIWNNLPPFHVGQLTGELNGKPVNCAIISVQITPTRLVAEGGRSMSGPSEYARPRIMEAADLADRMGAGVWGLGETLAALTKHGTRVKDEYPGVEITTGHAFTTYFSYETIKDGAARMGTTLDQEDLTIIGVGSIGSAVMRMAIEDGVGGLHLHDKTVMRGRLEKTKAEIEEAYPHLRGKIRITAGNDQLKDAFAGSRIGFIASSEPRPFIKAEHIEPGTWLVNDAMPAGVTRSEALKADSTTAWVVSKRPITLRNSFDTGLVDGGEWTCQMETVVLGVIDQEDRFETVGPVTTERARAAGKVAEKYGIGLTEPQSWGVLESTPVFDSNRASLSK
jgi:predicted amino acid dehydrogenase